MRIAVFAVFGLARLRPQMRADEKYRVVLQILSDPWQIGAHLDAERTQVGRRPNTGAHQQRG